jgi:hypothetical protein
MAGMTAVKPSAGAIAAAALPCRRFRRVIGKSRIPVADVRYWEPNIRQGFGK